MSDFVWLCKKFLRIKYILENLKKNNIQLNLYSYFTQVMLFFKKSGISQVNHTAHRQRQCDLETHLLCKELGIYRDI